MRFALMIEPQQGLTYDDQLAVARTAERAGFEALFRSDHYASFPGDALSAPPPRALLERGHDLVRWTDMPRGGHFAAMEEPDLFVDDVRAWAKTLA